MRHSESTRRVVDLTSNWLLSLATPSHQHESRITHCALSQWVLGNWHLAVSHFSIQSSPLLRPLRRITVQPRTPSMSTTMNNYSMSMTNHHASLNNRNVHVHDPFLLMHMLPHAYSATPCHVAPHAMLQRITRCAPLSCAVSCCYAPHQALHNDAIHIILGTHHYAMHHMMI